MPRYACFTNTKGEQTWWELLPNGRWTFVADENDLKRGRHNVDIMDAHQARMSNLVRTDHDDLPDEVWARIAAHVLTKGSD